MLDKPTTNIDFSLNILAQTGKLFSVQILGGIRFMAYSVSMSLRSFFMACGLAGLLSGCATHDQSAALNNGNGADGMLMVYSAYAVNADFNRRDTERPEYSGYNIYQADGRLWQFIRNSSDTIMQEPQRVELPSGDYRIVARVNGHGLETIPVTIESRRKTVLYLNGKPLPADNQAAAVHAIDGQIVGWQMVADR